MDIYLPIAGQSVNALFIVILGFLVGVLSGMFGVGGGFLTTPLLIFYGIPPTVAVASASTQITGASVSGVMVHMRRGGVDVKMGAVMTFGGLLGSVVGAALFRILQSSGQIDVVVGSLYVLILVSIGLGALLGYGLIAKYALSGNADAARSGEAVHAKLASIQVPLGIAGIALGILMFVFRFIVFNSFGAGI